MNSTQLFWIFLMIVMVCFTLIIITALNRQVERDRPAPVFHNVRLRPEFVNEMTYTTTLINGGMTYDNAQMVQRIMRENNFGVIRHTNLVSPPDSDETVRVSSPGAERPTTFSDW